MAFLSLATVSCSDFLDEEQKTARSNDFYKTAEGVEALATSTYNRVLLASLGAEAKYCYTNYGTDEFQEGGDGSNATFNSYDVGLASVTLAANGNTTKADAMWNELYLGIGDANQLIQSASAFAETNAQSKVNLGEGYFFRAYSYLQLVEQFGGVPLKLTPSNTVEKEFTRATAKEVMQQVIDDFNKAYELLPEKTTTTGKLDKSCAAHFLAKAYLFRASEINDSWNGDTKQADLEKIVPLCDEVIAKHPLAKNFSDLWNYTEPNGANESLSEIILSAEFTNDNAFTQKNLQHMFFLSRYDDLKYMKRDISGDRPYSRLGTTYYMYHIYDMVNDSRFWKSFKTKSLVNNANGDSYYKNGDLGIMYVINQPGDNRFDKTYEEGTVTYSKTGRKIPHVFVAYPKGKTDDGALYDYPRFPSLNKYIDGSRMAVNDSKGFRDVILARSAETYLIAAEAKIRLGDYQGALAYIKPVRDRAAYKEGEDRSAYVDGGAAYPSSPLNPDPSTVSYVPENSYYESNNIPVTTAATSLDVTDIHNLPAGDEYVIQKLGLTTDYDRMMCFLLDERSRELAGEFHRWVDLARTKTLVQRAKAFNKQAAQHIDEHHLLRPIPQTYLDGIQVNGRPLTSAEKSAQQNPGY